MSLLRFGMQHLLAAILLAAPTLALAQASSGPTGLIDPAAILPPPPADGSTQQQAELAELRDIQAVRTPDRLVQAQWDDAHEDATAFANVIGPGFDLKALPKTAALLAEVQAAQEKLASQAKVYFHRARPFVVDPNLVGCGRGTKAYTSYPSGHATMAYTIAPVLEALMPAKAEAIAKRAEDYVYSRLVCEVHYRSDLRAGQILGTWTAVKLLSAPALQSDFQAAKLELAAAGLTKP